MKNFVIVYNGKVWAEYTSSWEATVIAKAAFNYPTDNSVEIYSKFTED